MTETLCYGCGEIRPIKHVGSPRYLCYCRECIAAGLSPYDGTSEVFDPALNGADYDARARRLRAA